jgi:hypothetical protein
MKIVVIDTEPANAPQAAHAFLPKLIDGLNARGDEVIRVIKYQKAPPEEAGTWELKSRPASERKLLLHNVAFEEEELRGMSATDAARQLNEVGADIYLIWTAEEKAWEVLPLIDPKTATLAIAQTDAETFYAPIRHYRSFLTRLVGTTPETCVGLVLSCVVDKERVEWISYDEADDGENLQKSIETHRACFEKAVADALAAPREPIADFPPLKTGSAPSSQSWFDKLKAKIFK